MKWNTEYDSFLSFSSWLNTILYSVPAIVIILVFDQFDSTRPYIIPALIVYLVGAIAHMLGLGFQAVCIQIKVCTDYAVEHGVEKNKADS